MKRMMLPVVVGFALGIGGATGIVVVREREAKAAAVTRKPAGEGKTAGAPSADSATPLPGLPRPAAALDSAALADSMALALAVGAPSSPPVDTATATVAAPALPGAASFRDGAAAPAARPTLEGGKISKIFGAMQPREAARVLEQMDDADVRAILASLGDRKAAAIVANLPPQRAAGLTRGVVNAGKAAQ